MRLDCSSMGVPKESVPDSTRQAYPIHQPRIWRSSDCSVPELQGPLVSPNATKHISSTTGSNKTSWYQLEVTSAGNVKVT